MYRLSDKVMLVHLHTPQFGGSKEDKTVTKFVEDSFNVAGVGRWSKKLIPERLARISSHVQKARSLHSFYTVPWDLAGVGMLPSELYFEYMEKMQPIKDNFLMEVQKLEDEYLEVLDIEKVRLGPHFKGSDYPSPWKLSKAFRFETKFYPVPDSGDIRVALVDYEVDRLKQDLENNIKSTLASNTKELWTRVHRGVVDLVERLTSDRNIRYDSPVVDNLKRLSKVLPALNFAQDPDLDQMAKDIEDKLCQYKPEELRDDEFIKEKTKLEATKIEERLKNFI